MNETAARAAGIDPEVAVRIAFCESSLKPWSKNEESTAAGLYQFTAPTWEFIRAPGSPLDEDEAIKQFVKWYPQHPGWWECE